MSEPLRAASKPYCDGVGLLFDALMDGGGGGPVWEW